jgi:hypothetical protein
LEVVSVARRRREALELLHTHLGFIFPKVIPCSLVIISHYPVSYILGENIPLGEYSLSVDTSFFHHATLGSSPTHYALFSQLTED